jgi:hypothetical protein
LLGQYEDIVRGLWKLNFLDTSKKSKTLLFDFFDKKLFGDIFCDLKQHLKNNLCRYLVL